MERQIVPYTHQEQPDYVDNLLPGYRFCPTDAELILYYLKPKTETGECPKCRIYEVNLYNYGPEELTNQYRACDDKWYFFTPRERKYQKGKVPNRRTGDFGSWKTTQKYMSVYHHGATGPRVVGTRRSLEYRDETGCKTSWLMQEYTMNDPNLPIKSGQDGSKVLTNWVLCKIYKKKSNETDYNIVQAPHPLYASEEVELSITNSKVENQQNHSILIPTNSFPFPHGASTSTSNNPHVYEAQSGAYLSPVSNHIFQQPYSISTTTNGFRLTNGASSSTSYEPHVHTTQQTEVSLEDISQRNRSILITTNSFRFSEGASSSTSVESLVNAAQPPTYTTVTSEDVVMDDWDHIVQPDDFSIIGSVFDEDDSEFDISQWLSFDDEFITPQFT